MEHLSGVLGICTPGGGGQITAIFIISLPCPHMDNDRLNDRLMRLRCRRVMADYPDEYLKAMLEDAARAFEEYCNRPDMGEQIDSLICEIATIKVNREGVEGSNSAAEGTMSRTWEGGDLPEDILKRMRNYRMVKGL